MPFSHREFELLIAVYNAMIWPLQPIVHGAGVLMLVSLFRPSPGRDRWVTVFLAVLWAWNGIVYHLTFFARINPAAMVFGGVFIVQSALLFEAALHQRLQFGAASTRRAGLAWAVLIYAAVVYPLIGIWRGTGYVFLPAFGLTPCPLTMTTLGILLLAGPTCPRRLYVVPAAWAAVGGSAAILLDVPQDWPLLVGAVLLPLAALWRSRVQRKPSWLRV